MISNPVMGGKSGGSDYTSLRVEGDNPEDYVTVWLTDPDDLVPVRAPVKVYVGQTRKCEKNGVGIDSIHADLLVDGAGIRVENGVLIITLYGLVVATLD